MKRRVAITFTAALLGLALWSMTALSADDDEKKTAREAVLKLMETMQGGGNAQGQIAEITKKFDELEPLMYVYKARKKGGIGMGKDGDLDIELTIGNISNPRAKAKFTPKKLAEWKADLIKAGEMSKAIAKIAEQDKYTQQYGKKAPNKWKDYTKDMKKGAEELIKAARSDNVDAVKAAAKTLSDSCTSCHSDFRE
jgi:cytochrome c556